jgi:hypothetical protein
MVAAVHCSMQWDQLPLARAVLQSGFASFVYVVAGVLI